MTKKILLTGATDGIGLETAKRLADEGHTLLIHGRSEKKLTAVEKTLSNISGVGVIETGRLLTGLTNGELRASNAVSAYRDSNSVSAELRTGSP